MTADNDQQVCGAAARLFDSSGDTGPCVLPKGHNRGQADVPSAHQSAVEAHAYLVVYGDGPGIGWAGLDEQRAHEYARNTGSVVVSLPVIADYRPEETR